MLTMKNSIARTKGIAITNAFNELNKFAHEIELLKAAILDKISPCFKENSKEYKVDPTSKTSNMPKMINNDLFYEWVGLSLPILKIKSKTAISGYLSFQLSFSGDSVFNESISKTPFPLIHIIYWEDKLYKDSYFRYPISESEYFSDMPGKFTFIDDENNCVLSLDYDNYKDITCWNYSVELMEINSDNIEEILFKPAIELLENNKLILNNHKKLKDVIVRYPSLESVITE
ncbi:hypothetical protein [Gilliamella sp. Pas-s27]|uniref:hypothetical protein n=1 Tax=Gilliamella sp. Pas-s27 TaxID=2687311 RepID=UPI0013660958|nr:hypothetical protein [Gilliamella sp. Pas-s27]MWP47881.1 hypothetical protein [Gilliamella sp. Pas-s27]